MTGDAVKAQEIFQATMHELALRSAGGELPNDRLWLFRDARGRCLEASESGLQAESIELEEHLVIASAAAQMAKIELMQLVIWVYGAPEPHGTVFALLYIVKFVHVS